MLDHVVSNVRLLRSAEDICFTECAKHISSFIDWVSTRLPKERWNYVETVASNSLTRVAMSRLLSDLIETVLACLDKQVVLGIQAAREQLDIDLSHNIEEWQRLLRTARSQMIHNSLSKWAAFLVVRLEQGRPDNEQAYLVQLHNEIKNSAWRLLRLVRTELSWWFHQCLFSCGLAHTKEVTKHLYFSANGLLRSQVVGVREMFSSEEDEDFLFPPSHPNSRATMVLST